MSEFVWVHFPTSCPTPFLFHSSSLRERAFRSLCSLHLPLLTPVILELERCEDRMRVSELNHTNPMRTEDSEQDVRASGMFRPFSCVPENPYSYRTKINLN